jgi:hypothetical protein
MAANSSALETVDADYKSRSILDLMGLKGKVTVVTGISNGHDALRLG